MSALNGVTEQTETDAQIVDRVRRGDVQAYGGLVERYERVLLAAVLPVVREVHAARDVVQDVFVQCYVKLPTLRDGSRFGGWLLKIATREAIRASKRSRRHSALPEAAVEDDADRILCDEERRRLLDTVRGLPRQERLAVSLRYFEGHGVNEIATITGRSIGTVTKQLSRAIARLRDQLQNTRDSRTCLPKTQTSTGS